MSTNTTTLHQGSTRSGHGALAALLVASMLAIASLVAFNAGPNQPSDASTPVSDAQVQKALIDVRADERASRGATSDAAVERALIEVRAGERAPLGD